MNPDWPIADPKEISRQRGRYLDKVASMSWRHRRTASGAGNSTQRNFEPNQPMSRLIHGKSHCQVGGCNEYFAEATDGNGGHR
jgi:hypothetical protein